MADFEILCFGDSNTWGAIPVSDERYPRAVRWPGVMASELGAGFHVVAEGLNGRTTVCDDPVEDGRNGLRYLPACLNSHRPLDLVIVMLGTNDLKVRFSLTALDIAKGAERLVRVTQASACGRAGQSPAILLAVPPPIDPCGDFEEMFCGGREKSLNLRRRYSEVAQLHGCTLFDVGQHVAVDPADGIHYSAAAHRELGLAMAVVVRSMSDGRQSGQTGS